MYQIEEGPRIGLTISAAGATVPVRHTPEPRRMTAELGLGALFLSALVSATILPGGSEAVLAALALQGEIDRATLLAVATAGNTLGALTTFGLGWLAARRLTPEQSLGRHTERALGWLRRYGYWALLLSWLPVVGDALCLAGGWLGLPLGRATMALTVGKALRYAAVLAIF